MKKSSNDKALETYKIFPYVAWTLTLGFMLFVYNMTMELKAVANNLEAQTRFLQERIGVPPEQIENFDKDVSLTKPSI